MNLPHGVSQEANDRRPTVLLVDDDEVNLMLTAAALRERGFDITTSNGGEDALNRLASWTPDIVVLDAIMPGLDGFETCAQLRHMPGFDNVPVLMLTGLDDEASINRAYQVGGRVEADRGLDLGAQLRQLHGADAGRGRLERVRDQADRGAVVGGAPVDELRAQPGDGGLERLQHALDQAVGALRVEFGQPRQRSRVEHRRDRTRGTGGTGVGRERSRRPVQHGEHLPSAQWFERFVINTRFATPLRRPEGDTPEPNGVPSNCPPRIGSRSASMPDGAAARLRRGPGSPATCLRDRAMSSMTNTFGAIGGRAGGRFMVGRRSRRNAGTSSGMGPQGRRFATGASCAPISARHPGT